MSDDTTHIARPMRDDPRERARRDEEAQALCGTTASKDGSITCVPPRNATCWKCITLRCSRPLPTNPPVPEHDRLKKAKTGRDQTQLVGEFLEWLGEEGIVLARYPKDGDELYRVNENRKLLAKFFEIDENALESEKRALLDYMRDVNKAVEWAKTEGHKALRGT